MKRGDATVLSISAVLAATVVIAVAYSLLVLDRKPAEPPTGPSDSTSSLLVVTWGPSLCKVERSNRGAGPVMSSRWAGPSSCTACGRNRPVSSTANCPNAPPTANVTRCPAPRPSAEPEVTDVGLGGDDLARVVRARNLFGVAAPEYFGIAAALTDQAVRVLDPVFTKASSQVSSRSLREAFDAEFGRGAGRRSVWTAASPTARGRWPTR